MKIWLDDVRPKPPDFDIWVKDATRAIQLLTVGGVTEISLDHDLGDETALTGYDVAKHIEDGAYHGRIAPLTIAVHSANPVGRKNIEACIRNCKKYWARDYSGNH